MSYPAQSSAAVSVHPHRAAQPRNVRRWLGAGVLAALLAACTGTDGPTHPPIPVATTLELSATEVGFTSLTDAQQLTASVKDQNGSPMSGVAVSWASSNTGVATVSSTGLVTSVGNGTAAITATAGAASAAAQVIVQQVASSLALSHDSLILARPGDTLRVSATVRDAKGAAMVQAQLSWTSSDTLIARVNSSGLVTAISTGTAGITASSGGQIATTAARVLLVPAASVELTPSRAFLVTADTLHLTATVRDAGGAAITGHTVAWTVSDTSVASVSSTGRLLPKRAGTVTVQASASERSARATVQITQGNGLRVPELAVYDSVVPAIMAEYRFPGASFGVMKDGRLLLVRTYGWADTTLHQPVQPNSVFRLASLSKPITAAAVMKLVEDGRLSLDDKVFAILDDLTPPPGTAPDPRLADVTVRHLLSHSAGWHAGGTVDPLWFGRTASLALGEGFPTSPRTFARYWMGLPLTFAPGTNWSYGQIGYILAHLVIEKVTGKRYEDFVRETVLTPSGASGIRPGRTRLEDRLPNEVRYYYHPIGDMPDNTRATGFAPPEYGWHTLEGNLAAAGWVGTAVDYLRFFAAMDGNAARPDILSAATLQTMVDRPLPGWANATTWYALGWYSRGGFPNSVVYLGGNTWGTANWVRRTDDGVTVVLLTNGPVSPEEQGRFTAMNNALVAATSAVTTWPAHDLFSRY